MDYDITNAAVRDAEISGVPDLDAMEVRLVDVERRLDASVSFGDVQKAISDALAEYDRALPDRVRELSSDPSQRR